MEEGEDGGCASWQRRVRRRKDDMDKDMDKDMDSKVLRSPVKPKEVSVSELEAGNENRLPHGCSSSHRRDHVVSVSEPEEGGSGEDRSEGGHAGLEEVGNEEGAVGDFF